MRVAEARGILRRTAPFLDQLTLEREFVDQVRAVAVGDQQRAGRRPGDIARHELAVAQAKLLRRRELAYDLAVGRQQRDATFDRGRIPALGRHVPTRVHVYEVLHAVLFKDLQTMAATEPGADRTDIAAILLEDEEVVLRVIRHQVDATRLILGQRVRVDDGRDHRIDLGPLEVEGIAGRTMTKDDRGISSEERRDQEQGEQAHEQDWFILSPRPSRRKPLG